MNCEVKGAQKDERLEYIFECAKSAVSKLKKATDDERFIFALKMKLLDICDIPQADHKAMFDLISTAVAIELKKQFDILVTEWTFNVFREDCEEHSDDFSIWCSIKKEKPDYSTVVDDDKPIESLTPKIDVEAKAVDISGNTEVKNEVLIEASGMGHADSKQHIRMDV